MVKKWFALASLTGLAALASVAADAGCSSTNGGTATTDASTTADGQGGTSSTSSTSGSPAGSCLDTDPIDASSIAYVKASPTVKGACSLAELTALSDYYETHGGDQTFSAADWEGSVSRDCAACVFTDDGDPQNPPTSWNPILVKNDKLETVDQGGCIENVSGSFACGKAFQQLEACQVDACLVKCNSQKDFNACRQDTAVLTTSCKTAVDTVQSACGSAIQGYQNACNSTNFAFEGPIRVACVAPPAPLDGGVADGGDAGDGGS